MLPWQHTPVPFFRYHSKSPGTKRWRNSHGWTFLCRATLLQCKYPIWSKASVKACEKQKEPKQLLIVRQVCSITATRSNVKGRTHISEPKRFLDYSNNARPVFPAFPPLISQGLIKLWGFFSLGAAKCQKLIMRFMSHPHYNYTKMKHCKPLKDHQLTLGLPTSLWISVRRTYLSGQKGAFSLWFCW